jgi:hypothetical protein
MGIYVRFASGTELVLLSRVYNYFMHLGTSWWQRYFDSHSIRFNIPFSVLCSIIIFSPLRAMLWGGSIDPESSHRLLLFPTTSQPQKVKDEYPRNQNTSTVPPFLVILLGNQSNSDQFDSRIAAKFYTECLGIIHMCKVRESLICGFPLCTYIKTPFSHLTYCTAHARDVKSNRSAHIPCCMVFIYLGAKETGSTYLFVTGRR